MNDGPEEQFVLTLVGHGISIDKTVDRKTAMAIVAAVLSDGAIQGPIDRVDTSVRREKNLATSPAEFLSDSRASSNAEQITALGHFICRHEGKENFSKNDIKEGFRRAHEVMPKNLPRDFGTARKSGWIDEIPGRNGQYYVTNTGMQLIESKFGRAQ